MDKPTIAEGQRFGACMLLFVIILLSSCSTTAPAVPATPAAPLMATLSSPEEQHMGQALIQAAERGDLAEVERLLAQGAAINTQDGRGRTAVLAATHTDQVDMVQLLLERGADPNIRDAIKDNVLLYAGAEGKLAIVRLAIAAKADPTITNRYGGTALIPACERGHVEVVAELLLHSGVNVNHVNNLGWTGLLEAIILSNGGPRHQQIVRLLIAHGADVNLPDGERVTPLEHARRKGFSEIEQLLLAAGAREG